LVGGKSPASDSFGVLLRRHRLALGLSQEELADRSGLSVRAIADMERGRTQRPHRHSVQLLADALGLPEAQRLNLNRASRVNDSDLAAGLAQPQAEHLVPRELPAPVRHFTGRLAEMEELSEAAAGSGALALAICAVGGTAGVGKTALAVQWAHQVAERFPDGQLYANLRGYDLGEPVAAADALAGFLRTLGIPGSDIPDGAEDRSRLYRSRLAGRRVLVLLDNARDGEQVRPLLPGDPGCVAVVTSRDALAGLVATDGARRLHLDVLPLADAVALLRSLIGGRVDADPQATGTLADQCARLPLALRIAAELAAARPAAPLTELVAELAASQLDGLDAGEERADVRAVFSWSLRQLPEDAAGAFALIGLHPGADLDVPAAAALIGTAARQARRVLGQLHRASLLQASGPGRYSMHDLLRAYAREQAAAYDADGQCGEALTRLFDYYLSAAAAAMDTLFPAEAHMRPRLAPAAAIEPKMATAADARAWLDRERPNLAAVAVHCAEHGWPQHAADLAATMLRYLMYGSHLPEARTIYLHTLDAARRCGDPAAEAAALNGLAGVAAMQGHFPDASANYRAALECYRRCGDRAGAAKVLRNLGHTVNQLRDYRSAADYLREAVTASLDAGDNLGAARALASLATTETELGSYDEAAEHLQSALPVLREAEDYPGLARALEGMGELSLGRSQLTQATAFFEEALTIYRLIEAPTGVAYQLFSLGDISLREGAYQQAIRYLRQALALQRKAGYQHGEITTLRHLAQALHQAGQPAAARTELVAALRLATETGNTHQQACAHRELAEGHDSAGQHEQARDHWQQALDLFTQLAAPEADQVRSRLKAQEAKAPE
jgi:tetratricopeptide (TPR) repeat protein/transcriptional regulator with XRE-family HTH domain